jgi:hypothetical protein
LKRKIKCGKSQKLFATKKVKLTGVSEKFSCNLYVLMVRARFPLLVTRMGTFANCRRYWKMLAVSGKSQRERATERRASFSDRHLLPRQSPEKRLDGSGNSLYCKEAKKAVRKSLLKLI